MTVPLPIYFVVSLESQEATVLYQPHLITVDDIILQIGQAGFKASIKSKPRPLQLSRSELDCLMSTKTGPQQATEDATTALLNGSGTDGVEDCSVSAPEVQASESEGSSRLSNPRTLNVIPIQQGMETLKPGFVVKNDSGSPPLLLKPPAASSPVPPLCQPLGAVVEIRIEGMTCNSCVQSIEGMLSQHKGVKSAQVSLANHNGTFEYDPLVTSEEELREAIEDMGFDAFLHGRFYEYKHCCQSKVCGLPRICPTIQN